MHHRIWVTWLTPFFFFLPSPCHTFVVTWFKTHTKKKSNVCLLATTDKLISKPTPLYGQPSWWGEDEDPATKIHNRSGKATDLQTSGPRMPFANVSYWVDGFHLFDIQITYTSEIRTELKMTCFSVASRSDALSWVGEGWDKHIWGYQLWNMNQPLPQQASRHFHICLVLNFMTL